MHGLSRREFLLTAVSATFVSFGCRAEVDPTSRIANLEIPLPRLIFFPECRSGTDAHCQSRAVHVTAMGLDRRASTVELELSNGRRLMLDAEASFARSTGPMLHRVRLKSLAAWGIDHAVRRLRKLPRRSGDALQVQEVLDAVTPGALFELLERAHESESASRVGWDGSASAFVVQ